MSATDREVARNGAHATCDDAWKTPRGINITINHFHTPYEATRPVVTSSPDSIFEQVIDDLVAEISKDQAARTATRPEPASPRMVMTRSAHEEILGSLATRPPESGGILVGPKNHHLVTHFVFDQNAKVTASTYTPDLESLNAYLKGAREFGLDMKGIVHSHPAGVPYPSSYDLEYVLKIFANPRHSALTEYLFPIVCDGKLHPYVFTRQLLNLSGKNSGSLRRSIMAEVVLI